MKNKNIFSDEMINKFNKIGSKLYNLKYAIEHFVDSLENETDVSLEIICLSHILKHYFNDTKLEYNKLEEELNTLL